MCIFFYRILDLNNCIEISHVMTTSEDYDELSYTWKEWRDKSGKLMRNGYKDYVSLVNKAAKLNSKISKLN